jgi:hypothetical protein
LGAAMVLAFSFKHKQQLMNSIVKQQRAAVLVTTQIAGPVKTYFQWLGVILVIVS